ncbi:MAG: hypothetical protein WAM39_15485 [Bryobacteraceae bacterium]
MHVCENYFLGWMLSLPYISQTAVHLYALAAIIFAARLVYLDFIRMFPSITIYVWVNAIATAISAACGPDSKISADVFEYSTPLFLILAFLCAGGLFKELYSQQPGLKTFARKGIIGAQVLGILIALCAVPIAMPRWNTKGFECVAFVLLEIFRCITIGLAGFAIATYWKFSRLPMEIPKTTRFLVVWYLSETLITPLMIALGFVVFPYNTRYNDIANVVACGIWTAIALAGLRLTRPNMGKVETPLPQGPTKRISEIAALVELLTRSHQ